MSHEGYFQAARQLGEPSGNARRDTLAAIEREWEPAEVAAFCEFLRGRETAVALELCPALAEATRPELLAMLAEYALRSDRELQNSALTALEKLPAQLRGEPCRRLLKAPAANVRAAACRLLGMSAAGTAAPDLVARLGDESPDVVRAALGALRRLHETRALPELARLLEHAEPTVRLDAVRSLAELADEREFPAAALSTRLASEADLEVRVALARALGKHPHRSAQAALLRALEQDPEVRVQRAAVEALGAFPSPEVARALLGRATSAAEPSLSTACARALGALKPELVLPLCRELLEEKSAPALRLSTALMMAELETPGVAELLCERLRVETDPGVACALVEALGQGGWREAWPELHARARGEELVGYAAVAALGELLDEAHFADYASLLTELSHETLREAVLKRLTLYGRTRRLPADLTGPLLAILRGGQRNNRVLAAEAAGLVEGADVSASLLEVLRDCDDEALVQALLQSVLRLAGADLASLAERVDETHLRQLARVLGKVGGLGESGPAFCRLLARRQAAGATSAQECLEATAQADPAALRGALSEATGEELESLVHAWRKLPENLREEVPLDRLRLLGAAQAGVRAAVLSTLTEHDDLDFLPPVVDLAVLDPDPEVRHQARLATRRLTGA